MWSEICWQVSSLAVSASFSFRGGVETGARRGNALQLWCPAHYRRGFTLWDVLFLFVIGSREIGNSSSITRPLFFFIGRWKSHQRGSEWFHRPHTVIIDITNCAFTCNLSVWSRCGVQRLGLIPGCCCCCCCCKQSESRDEVSAQRPVAGWSALMSRRTAAAREPFCLSNSQIITLKLISFCVISFFSPVQDLTNKQKKIQCTSKNTSQLATW